VCNKDTTIYTNSVPNIFKIYPTYAQISRSTEKNTKICKTIYKQCTTTIKKDITRIKNVTQILNTIHNLQKYINNIQNNILKYIQTVYNTYTKLYTNIVPKHY